jgi:hypothetical protein
MTARILPPAIVRDMVGQLNAWAALSPGRTRALWSKPQKAGKRLSARCTARAAICWPGGPMACLMIGAARPPSLARPAPPLAPPSRRGFFMPATLPR